MTVALLARLNVPACTDRVPLVSVTGMAMVMVPAFTVFFKVPVVLSVPPTADPNVPDPRRSMVPMLVMPPPPVVLMKFEPADQRRLPPPLFVVGPRVSEFVVLSSVSWPPLAMLTPAGMS